MWQYAYIKLIPTNMLVPPWTRCPKVAEGLVKSILINCYEATSVKIVWLTWNQLERSAWQIMKIAKSKFQNVIIQRQAGGHILSSLCPPANWSIYQGFIFCTVHTGLRHTVPYTVASNIIYRTGPGNLCRGSSIYYCHSPTTTST